MKNKEDKNVENLVDRMMKETSLETPFIDFTSTVMSEVLAIDKGKSISYKPVISNSAWFIIFAAIGGLITWLILNGYTENETATYFDLSFIKAAKILNLVSGLKLSVVTTNIILLAMALIFIQIILLKGYLNKRFHK